LATTMLFIGRRSVPEQFVESPVCFAAGAASLWLCRRWISSLGLCRPQFSEPSPSDTDTVKKFPPTCLPPSYPDPCAFFALFARTYQNWVRREILVNRRTGLFIIWLFGLPWSI
jgi:hypothetical protein